MSNFNTSNSKSISQRVINYNNQLRTTLTLLDPPIPILPTYYPTTSDPYHLPVAPVASRNWNIFKMKVDNVWNRFGVSGQDKRVVIVDHVFYTSKKDLIDPSLYNTTYQEYYNSMMCAGIDLNIFTTNVTSSHGDMVASVIVSRVNGLGLVGVAPLATWSTVYCIIP